MLSQHTREIDSLSSLARISKTWTLTSSKMTGVAIAPAPPSAESGFRRLPEEVLARIVNLVQELSRAELPAIKEQKKSRIVKCRKPPRTNDNDFVIFWSYSLEEPPILTTLQSLSAVSRQLNRICQPVLWEVSTFKLLALNLFSPASYGSG